MKVYAKLKQCSKLIQSNQFSNVPTKETEGKIFLTTIAYCS